MPLTQHAIEAAAAELRAERDARDAALATVWRKLDPLIEVIADVLAELSNEQWNALGAEERETVTASLQFWDLAGNLPETLIPEVVIGARVMSLFAKKYPHLAGDGGELQ